MKTPEEMAIDYCEPILSNEYARAIGREDWIGTRCVLVGEGHEMYKAFLAGYQAAKEEEATKDQKIAVLWTESIRRMLPSVHEVVLFPSESTKASDDEVVAKMDAAIKKAKDQVADANEVMNSSNNSNGWVSVKDRLPEVGKEILWYHQPGGEFAVGLLHNRVEQPFFTHWMPLPAPPKEEK